MLSALLYLVSPITFLLVTGYGFYLWKSVSAMRSPTPDAAT